MPNQAQTAKQQPQTQAQTPGKNSEQNRSWSFELPQLSSLSSTLVLSGLIVSLLLGLLLGIFLPLPQSVLKLGENLGLNLSSISTTRSQAGLLYANRNKTAQQANQPQQYLAFLREVKTIINEHYWQHIPESTLTQLFKQGTEKLSGQHLDAKIDTFAKLEPQLTAILRNYQSNEQKQEFTTQLADLVLANLEPHGRSRLYSQRQQQQLKNRVNNIDPDQDHYQTLQVEREAQPKQIQQAYQQKKQDLQKQSKQATAGAKQQIQQQLNRVEKARQALVDQANRQRYDQAGISPTMDWQLLAPSVAHIWIHKFAPTTIQELTEVAQKLQQASQATSARSSQLNSLILDLRGNVGGAIDGLPYFLGPFIGQNQYAYQFIQQGRVKDFKTKTGWLPALEPYKKVVILIDQNTQSSAEVMASVLKKYNVGVLVGTTTKGWGTVERVFPLETKLAQNHEYGVFLVHHLTLRANGQPIEGNGVKPLVDVGQPDWEQDLQRYFSDEELVEFVRQTMRRASPP